MRSFIRNGAAVTVFVLGIAGSAQAAENTVAKEDFSGTNLRFAMAKEVFNVTISVRGPDGYQAEKFIKSGAPALNLEKHGKIADGRYIYQITAALEGEFEPVRGKLNNGRGKKAKKRANKSIYQDGAFHVVEGQITPVESLAEESGLDQD